ncbi:site-specific integrase [Brevundimonas fontaquae]|uniref:Tyrosine-type recombinase/integrase n=1 Tax=Brevundimonas fontaquae TaxID=2813778 RepID=A0ABX7LSW9_9CAUL|nr:site-specific integrase [Brevundimonas fontaquae]QSF55150.1 tyrosine-type recombinase/integrase [Brevundimonas fontaquae]
MPRLTRKLIETLEPRDGEYSVRDTEVIGLGVRVRPSGVKSFILTYRRGGQLRKLTLGRADEGYSIEEARDHARAALRDVREGVDPQAVKIADRHALTVNAMIDHYMADGPAMKPNKKPSSWDTNRTLFDCHIRPLLGRRLAQDLTRLDIAKFQLEVSQGKTARNIKTGYRKRSRVTGGKRVAALAVVTLGAAYEFAILTDLLKVNPTKGVERFQTIRRERYLSDREIAAISEALAQFEREDPRHAVMADTVRLLILTGCRKSEILSLRWDYVDWDVGCLRLPESKTGAKTVPLADAAIDLLRRRWDEGRSPEPSRGHNSGYTSSEVDRSPYVLPALKGQGHFVGLPHLWTKVKVSADEILRQKAAEASKDPRDVRSLLNVRLHDLRHSFASFAIAGGASLFMVGKVLGHKQARTTEIYAHLSDDPLKQLANRTAARLSEAMRF